MSCVTCCFSASDWSVESTLQGALLVPYDIKKECTQAKASVHVEIRIWICSYLRLWVLWLYCNFSFIIDFVKLSKTWLYSSLNIFFTSQLRVPYIDKLPKCDIAQVVDNINNSSSSCLLSHCTWVSRDIDWRRLLLCCSCDCISVETLCIVVCRCILTCILFLIMVYACIPPAAPTHHQDVDISPIPGPGKIIIYSFSYCICRPSKLA